MNKNLLITVIVSLVIGVASSSATSFIIFSSFEKSSPKDTEIIKLNTDTNLYINAIEKVSPAVVSVIASKDLSEYYNGRTYLFFPGSPFKFNIPQEENKSREKTQIGGGTGFIITENGLMVTNRHVVEDEQAEYTVLTNEQEKYYATVITKDPINDLSVLQLFTDQERSKKPSGLAIAELGNSDELKIGSQVIAIGNALSEFDNTTTAGIISGKGREITASSGSGMTEKLTGLLQTDAAINPGNSGGPLINLAGQVIGINTAVAAQANGIGFAIPINELKPAIESVEKFGKIVRPFLGVRYTELTPEIANALELNTAYGAYIQDDIQTGTKAVVKDSPADKAGVLSGDIIIAINSIKINTEKNLSDLIKKYKVGDTVTAKILRNGKELNLKIKLEEFKN